MEPGVQTPDETLERACGSCRDSGWLLVQIMRALGVASRFASGYLIQLKSDVKPLDGPAGPERDFTDLHAWAEAYIPGAGWIGFDPTSGLLAGEGHLPLACTADPGNAAPVIGFADVANTAFEVAMSVTRIHEDPRVTKPYSEEEWARITGLGRQVDADLVAHDVRLTQGGEPTFVSVHDMDGPKWLIEQSALPANADPFQADLASPAERARLARLLQAGLDQPAGFVLPLKATHEDQDATILWETSPWPIRRERLYALAGDSPLGLRLPLGSLPDVAPDKQEFETPVDPFAPHDALPKRSEGKPKSRMRRDAPGEIIKTALTVETRGGHVRVFMPPLTRIEAYAALIATIERTASKRGPRVA